LPGLESTHPELSLNAFFNGYDSGMVLLFADLFKVTGDLYALGVDGF
jgi:hypothetical protein